MSDEQTGSTEPTGGPAATPPPPPAWAAPGGNDPQTVPDVPTVPAPSTPPPPPAWPAQPPSAPQPPVGGWGPPTAPHAPPAPGMPTAPPPGPKKSRAGLVIGILVVLLLVVGGFVAAAVVLLAGSSEDLELSIDTCEIAADGSLSATGTVSTSGGDTTTPVQVDFIDTTQGGIVDTDEVSVQVSESAAERWRVTGSAGDEVQQVTCEVTAGG